MPKRVGFIYEKVISVENCTAAEIEMTDGKKHDKRVERIKADPESYGAAIALELSSGAWNPKPYKQHIIHDGIRKKERLIKVPCLHDQAVHHAVMRITAPYIERRNYFYNCGSIPDAGQDRVTRAIKRWLSGKKIIKYGETLDIKKFYDSCPHWVVMQALRRIFKDERFLALHQKILDSMSSNGIGLAIGFNPSHWYANLALAHIERIVKEAFPKKTRRGKKEAQIRFARYMDDMAILSNSKRVLNRARVLIATALSASGMLLKRSWQVFQIKLRGFQFLSYRFFHGFTILKKSLMYRISRKAIKAARHLTPHAAAGVLSHNGILKHCDSCNFKKDWIIPMISIKKCKEIVSNESRIRAAARAVQAV